MRAVGALLPLLAVASCSGGAHETETVVVDEWTRNTSRDVDLLVMVDDSSCFAQEQIAFAGEIEALLRALTSGDADGDGTPDTVAASSVRVGVVTSDMGTGGYDVPTCDMQPFGRDGILRTDANTTIAGCPPSYPPFLAFAPPDDPVAAATQLRCVAQMGTGGCGFEQPLDAVLKALTPASSPIRFALGSQGHGDGENAEFLRQRSLLAVLVLTDEEDTSAVDVEIYDPASTRYPGDLNLRGYEYPEARRPVEEYVEGLLALRPGEPERVLFASLTGIPPELGGRTVAEVDAILADPRMTEQIDRTSPTPRLVPSCNIPELGIAFPAPRIVHVGREIAARGGHTVAATACADDFGPQLEDVARAIGDALGPRCLASLPPEDADCRLEANGTALSRAAWRIETTDCPRVILGELLPDLTELRLVCDR